MRALIRYGLTVMGLLLLLNVYSQNRLITIEKSLKELAVTEVGLQGKVELSVSGVSIQEFIRAIAAAHNLNVSIDPGLNATVANNFSNANVTDVFLYLCRQYDLDVEIIGSIVSFKKYIPPAIIPEPVPAKIPQVVYHDKTSFLSLDLKADSLDEVVKAITSQSLRNVILAPDLKGKMVSVFIQNRPFDDAMDKLAYANGLVLRKTEDGFYLLESLPVEAAAGQRNTSRNQRNGRGQGNTKDTSGELGVSFNDGLLTVDASNVPVSEIIAEVSRQAFCNYFLFSEPQGNSTLYIENATYEQFLNYLLNGSDFTYKKQEDVFLIGERKIEGLRTTELVRMENRTIETVIDFIPAELKRDVEIKEFVELNGLILSGSHPLIKEIKEFLREIDQVVPVVMIDVIIVDVSKSNAINAGIKAGIGGENAPEKSSGTISPGVQFDLNSQSVNRLISGFNGFGLVNLGKVAPDFYLSIQAMESNGILRTRSTPQLATLNGHEANLRIGKTEYYLEVNNNVIGSQNPQNIITQTYKATNADLSITIKPIVSGDEHVTMEISVEQSDFTGRISENAPPGTVSRNFQSTIRVKNDDMILLGGLEEKTSNNSGSGLPFLSRVPVIKWFTGSRTKEESKSKLNIFIRPTIIY